MKRIAFTLLLYCSCIGLLAQCPTGDIIFSTQGQIDSFPINYPGCKHLLGNVIIQESSLGNIIHLDSLLQIESIGGDLGLWGNPALKSLSGLDNLTSISGGLHVQNNLSLTSLSGLDNLAFIGEYLFIIENDAMTSLSGLENLTSLNGDLYVDNNTVLVSLSGLGNLTFLGGDLYVAYNDALPNLSSLENLNSINGYLHVLHNPALTSLNGLNNLTSVAGYLIVANNHTLTSLNALGNLTFVGWYFGIFNNDALPSLNGLDNLTSIGEYLSVSYNAALTSLIALNNLTSIGGELVVQSNDALMSLSGLDNIDPATITDIRIENNPHLSLCGVQSVCIYLESVSSVTISNNSPGCNSVDEVEAACMVSIEEIPGGEPIAYFSPNPAADFVQIQINDSKIWDISLHDVQGRQKFQKQVFGSQIIWVKDWPSGVYVLRAVTGRRAFSQKIFKQ